MAFDKKQTSIAKGIAILLLLWRHFFQMTEDVKSVFSVFGMPVELFFDIYSIVCVSMFLLLSGYGLQKSFDSYFNKNCSEKSMLKLCFLFTKRHICKILFEYIFIFILSLSVLLVTKKVDFISNCYNGNVLYFIINALGLSNCFSTPTLFGTWWFTGLIIVLYLLFPILWGLNRYCSEILLVLSITVLLLPGHWDFDGLRMWNLPFVLGMYIAKKDLINRSKKVFDTKLKKIIFCGTLLFSSVLLRSLYALDTEKFDSPFALALILISFMFLSRVSVLNTVLYHLGNRSSLMYLMHPLIFYVTSSIFGYDISILSYIVLVVICFMFAWLIYYLQKLIRYDNLINKIA